MMDPTLLFTKHMIINRIGRAIAKYLGGMSPEVLRSYVGTDVTPMLEREILSRVDPNKLREYATVVKSHKWMFSDSDSASLTDAIIRCLPKEHRQHVDRAWLQEQVLAVWKRLSAVVDNMSEVGYTQGG